MDKNIQNAVLNKNLPLLHRIAAEAVCPAVRKEAQHAAKKLGAAR